MTRDGYTIDVKVFEPRRPVAAVQVMHGIAEHMARYDEFNTWLAANDIYVVTHNHRGHGPKAERFGHFDDFNDLIEDALFVSESIPSSLKKFILGHSMGSVVARRLLERNRYDGGIIVGTGNREKFSDFVSDIFLHMLAKAQPESHSKRINTLAFGSYDNMFAGDTKNRWLSKNQQNVDDYNTDPYAGQLMSNKAFSEFIKHLSAASNEVNLSQYNESVPLLIIGGKDDPFSNKGKDIRSLSKTLIRYTDSVTVQLYDDSRHEVLNEDNRAQVYNKLLEWVIRHVE